MPLESFSGPAVDVLLARVRTQLGPEAEIIAVRAEAGPDGRKRYQVIAADPEAADLERRRMGTSGGGHPLLRAAPGRTDLARRREGDKGPQLIAFVGPTGVGKTTTIAKLATHPDYLKGRKVGLLCLDTYRVGAIEQIRAYAEIAALPLEVVYEGSDLAPAMRRLGDRDVILVDTPGRGPRAQADAQQVKQWLSQLQPAETHLVLQSGLQRAVADRMIEAHRAHGITHLVATKLDEAPDDWTLFDAAAEARLPMRWVSDGQEVPKDLRPAAQRLLAAVAALRLRAAEPAEVLA